MTRFRRTVAIDFDGVLHKHLSKWTVAHEIHDGPVPGALDFLERVLKEFNVVIFSARAADPEGAKAIAVWLLRHWRAQGPGMFDFGKPLELLNGLIEITAQKPHAFIYIDDRGWRFEGTFPTMDELRTFESWTKKPPEPLTPKALRQRARELWDQGQVLARKRSLLIEESNRLFREALRIEHPCACVQKNGDIGIHDMGAFAKSGRESLEAGGLVSDVLSADKCCASCGGTGVPRVGGVSV